MITVYKYPFEIGDVVTLTLPRDFEVVLVECQEGVPCLWARIDTSKPLYNTKFLLTGTGHPVPRSFAHVASFQHGPFVWHMWR